MKVWLITDWHGYNFICAQGCLEEWVVNEARNDYQTIFWNNNEHTSCEIDEADANPEGDNAYSANLVEVYNVDSTTIS